MARRPRQDLQFVTGTYEAWLRSQPPEEGKKGHKQPEPDLYERWLSERVLRRWERLEHGSKKRFRPGHAV